MEKKRAENRELHLTLIDIQKAYDSVTRNSLWEAMNALGIETGLIEAVGALYKNNMVAVKRGQRIGNKLQTSKGLLQDYLTSPICPKYI